MQLLKFVPIKLTLFLVAGILFGSFIETSISIPLIATITTLLIVAILLYTTRKIKSVLFGSAALLLTFCIGFLAITLTNPVNTPNHYAKISNTSGKELRIKIIEVLKPNSFSRRYFATILEADKRRTIGKIILSIKKDSSSQSLKVDDELITFNTLSSVKAPLNPHQFNYKKYLKGLGVYDQLYATSDEYILLEDSKNTLYGLAAHWRTTIIKKLKEQNFNPENLSVIQALLLGQRNDISAETYDNYKDAGAIHILALSGLHIGILLLILQFLLQPLERLPHGKKIKLAVILLFLWSFALLAGLSASIVRAVTMFSFLAYAMFLNRPTNSFNILALSLFFILLIQPNYLFQVGFQMSYAAVFAILWIYPMLQGFWFPKNKIVKYFWQLLSVSIAAQLGVLPISLFYFHQFPGLFFVANLLIIPFLGIILGIGIVIIILSLTNTLPAFIADGYNMILNYMNSIVRWIAHQETFVFKSISFDTVQLLLLYSLTFLIVIAFSSKRHKVIIAFLIGLIALQSYTFFLKYKASTTHESMVLHQSRATGILEKTGTSIHLLSTNITAFEYTLKNYQIEERIETFAIDTLRNSYLLEDKRITIIDSLGIYPSHKRSTILLTQSPKINLERLIDSIQPLELIADGSNYRSDVARWKATCIKRKLPFHDTGEKGAYYLRQKD
ncbi:ComEC/Rec2 family competence protein [Cellulophaga sp. HaHa_2_95]|uniref:ComEC/Rec2 family competence protein n=1 Tax=Cellulophaga sp. HaHa_2_95 TaxID=2745558 RepID=UPI001C4F8CB1|nr:ComEC/Rec2 family competence protein [Cellulophaga sp. HaHa_2_95]QXP57096.1 ComEC/Rec2 family competence protein [Cellulophaga sp. HaHa_2_95]